MTDLPLEQMQNCEEALTEMRPVPERCFSAPELICALLSFPAAYLYCSNIFFYTHLYHSLPFALVALFLVGASLWLNQERRAEAETYVWFICFILCCISGFFGLNNVWDEAQLILFIHIFFVWWVLCRSGSLVEGQSGHLLPLDALNGFVLFPFGNYLLRIKCLVSALKTRHTATGKKRLLLLPALLCLVLFIAAVCLLTAADDRFAEMLSGFVSIFSFEVDFETVMMFLFSLPVGAWLFGLIGGTAKHDRAKLAAQRENVYGFLARIRKIPVLFWAVVLALFSALYIAFFILQASYLFGAFTRTLPEGFIVSQYARQGFFELCKVMAVNFSVLWLVTRMADEQGRNSRLFTTVCMAFLTESILFAVIALSKLGLYISCFGFTPLRLQSSWLVCVLLAGCVFWMVSLLTGRKVFRKWMFFGAVSLSVLTLF